MYSTNESATVDDSVPAQPRRRHDNGPRQRARYQSGVAGVNWNDKAAMWVAQWFSVEHGKIMNKAFSVKHYGFKESMLAAIKYRRSLELSGEARLKSRRNCSESYQTSSTCVADQSSNQPVAQAADSCSAECGEELPSNCQDLQIALVENGQDPPPPYHLKSGFRGVSWNQRMNAWLAFWTEDNKRRSKTFAAGKHGGIEDARDVAVEWLQQKRASLCPANDTTAILPDTDENMIRAAKCLCSIKSCLETSDNTNVTMKAEVPQSEVDLFWGFVTTVAEDRNKLKLDQIEDQPNDSEVSQVDLHLDSSSNISPTKKRRREELPVSISGESTHLSSGIISQAIIPAESYDTTVSDISSNSQSLKTSCDIGESNNFLANLQLSSIKGTDTVPKTTAINRNLEGLSIIQKADLTYPGIHGSVGCHNTENHRTQIPEMQTSDGLLQSYNNPMTFMPNLSLPPVYQSLFLNVPPQSGLQQPDKRIQAPFHTTRVDDDERPGSQTAFSNFSSLQFGSATMPLFPPNNETAHLPPLYSHSKLGFPAVQGGSCLPGVLQASDMPSSTLLDDRAYASLLNAAVAALPQQTLPPPSVFQTTTEISTTSSFPPLLQGLFSVQRPILPGFPQTMNVPFSPLCAQMAFTHASNPAHNPTGQARSPIHVLGQKIAPF
eukprot:Filipodium_phascolosomae@DN1396_c0_g1_i1.p1